MATARLYIPIGTQTYGPIPGGSDITEAIGSNEFETVKIAADGNVLLDGSFVRGNDCLVIQSASANYLISSTVAGITLTGKVGTEAEGAIIRIPAFAAGGGLKLDFTDVIDVDLVTTDGENYTLVGPDGDQDITGTPVALTIGDTSGGGGGGGGTADEISLTVGGDLFTGANAGGAGNTTFTATIFPNQNGEQTNQLQSGDQLDGGGGYNTLDAEVQDASALNGAPRSEIVLRTTRVDHLKIEAQQAGSASDDDAIQLDAGKAFGVQKITSSFSDASLTVYNVNTMGDGGLTDPVNGLDNGRPTASIELCMDHTAGDNVLFCESDFEVYFDADYLIPGQPTNETVIRLQLMDIDNSFLTNQPLKTNPYDRIFIDLPGVPDGSDPVVIVTPSSFDDTGVLAYNKLVQSINNGLAAAGLTTFTAVLGEQFSVLDPDGDPGGLTPIFGYEILIIDSAGTPLTAANIQFGASGLIPSQTDYQKQVFVNTDTTVDLITSILCVEKVGLLGDGGDFIVGSMTTGGVERFILEVKGFDDGDGVINDQDSSLAMLASTNNTLREVILWADADASADITIGNGVTDGTVPNMWNPYLISADEAMRYDDEYCGDLYPDTNPCDLTDTRNNALKDVQLFTAAGAQGKAALNSNVDVTLYAHLSAAFTGKYLDLLDTQVAAEADNVQATYLFSGGNDLLNMNVSKSNFAFQGAATREDFSFFADMGAGNDVVEFQIGDGQFGNPGDQKYPYDELVPGSIEELAIVFGGGDNWYTNHLLSDNVGIVTGSGNDIVTTWGSTAATIHLGSGDDVVYTDNSGGGSPYNNMRSLDHESSYFNCCRATWVFNAQSSSIMQPEVNNLLSYGRASISNLINASLYVHYQDLTIQVELGDSWGSINGVTVSDLTIRQAIQDAVNNTVLSSFLEAKEGPNGTLLVLSKIDGNFSPSDLSLNIGRYTVNGANVPLTASQTAPSAAGRLLSTYTAAELNPLGWNTDGTPFFEDDGLEPGDGARWDSEFAYDMGKYLDGVDSANVNNNRVWGSTGSDDIVLSSNATSIEHVIIKNVATERFSDSPLTPDYIVNFSAAIVDAFVPAETEVQMLCPVFDDLDEDVADQPFALTITTGVGTRTVNVAAGDDRATILGKIVAQLNGYNGLTAVIDDMGTPLDDTDDCVTVTYPTGNDYALLTTQVSAVVPTEIQTLTISTDGDVLTPADQQILVSFAGQTFLTAVIPSGSTANQIAGAIQTAIGSTVGNDNISASVAGNVVTLNYFGDTDPLPAGTAVLVQSGDNVTTIEGATTQPFDAFAPGVGFAATDVNDGAPALNPALGFDIFDVTAVVGARPGYFANTQQDNSNNAEANAINTMLDANTNSVILIDTLDGNNVGGGFEFAYTGSPTTELARLQQIVAAGDDNADTRARTDIIITVRNDGHTDVGLSGSSDGLTANWYQVDDAVGTGNATVTYMGTMKLMGYDSLAVNKDPIGNWDAMTIANFTYQTPTNLMDTYVGGIA